MNPFLRVGRQGLMSVLGLLLLVVAVRPAAAQNVALYGFTAATDTYTPLTGAAPVTINGGGGSTDDGYSVPLPLPFSFQFGAATFNTVTLASNGYLGFGTHTTIDNYRVMRHPQENNVVAFANVDLEPEPINGSSYSVVVEGTSPSRIWKMQAHNFQRYQGVGGVTGKTGQVQVWLYERSNKIEIHYGNFSGLWGTGSFGARFDSVQVGLRGVGTADLAAITGTWQAPTKVNSSRAALPMEGPAGDIPDSTIVFRFTFPNGTDLTPPSIGPVTLTPPPGCTPASHTVSVRPSDASGIQSVILTYSVGGSTTTTLPMTDNAGTWSATIPAQGSNQVSYTLVVTDASPQQNQSITNGSYADGQVVVNAGTDQTITTGTSATLTATGNPSAALKISEVTLNNFGSGRTWPRPAYIGAEDDFVEIANTGAADLNVGGYILEVRGNGANVARTYTLPAAAAIPAQNVLVIHLGPGTDSPANRYFHAGGQNDALASGADVGFLLSTPGGTLIDAVALNNYSFGPSVPTSQWSGLGAPAPAGQAGAFLRTTDLNNNTTWQVAADTIPQTLGAYNPRLTSLPLPSVRWSGGLLTGSNASNPLTTPVHNAPGTFTYTASLTQNNCTVTDQVVVTVINPVAPVADFIASATTVNQNTVIRFQDLSANIPSTWQWTFTPATVQFVNGTSATSRNPQVRLTTPTCYTVALTVTNGAGSNTRTKAAYVCMQLEYCTTNLQTAPCSADYIDGVKILGTTLSNRGTGCTSTTGPAYTAYPPHDSTTTTLRSGQRYTLAVKSAAAGAISAWIDYNGNGFFEGTEYISVARTLGPPLPATATVQFTVPPGVTTGVVALRVRNSALPNTITATEACLARNSGETEDYLVTLQPACALGTPTVRANSPLCLGSTLVLTATGVPSGATYTWHGPGGFTSAAAAPTVANLTAAQAGNYTLTVSLNGCTSMMGTVAVAVNAAPAAPPALSVSRCGPGSLTLRYATVPTGISYRWYATATGGAPIAGSGNSLITPSLSATTYYYVSAFQNGCESARTPVAAVVNAAPNPPTLTAGGPTTMCAGSTLTLTATGAPQGTPYVFKAGNTVVATTLSGTLAVTTAGTYTVTVATPEGCSAVSAPVSVTVTPQPSAAFAYPASTVCRNTATAPRPVITGTSGGTFTATPAGLSINAATGQVLVGGSQLGTYTVTYTVGTTCPATRSQSLTITNAPVATFAYNSTGPLCAHSAATVAPTFAAGASAGSFSASPAGLTLAAATGIVDLATSQPGTYTITNSIVPGGSCAAAAATATLTVAPAPTVTVTRTGAAAFCQGDSAVLTAAAPGGSAYLWSNGRTTPSIVVRQSGTYTVTVRNAGGCEVTSAPQVIVVSPATTATFAYPAAAYCLSDTSALLPTRTGTAGGTYAATPAGLTLDAATGRIARAASLPGTYTVTYTVGGPCPSSQSHTLTFTAAPVATFSYPATTRCIGATDTLTATLGAGATAGTFSATPAGLALDPLTGTIRVGASLIGAYTVTNTLPGAGACSAATATATFTVAPLPTLAITNLLAQYCTGDAPAPLTGTVNGVPGLGTFYLDGVPATTLNPALLGPGTHTVLLNGANASGCTTTTTQTFTVVASPPQPTFTSQPQGSGVVVLTSSAGTGNQWYFNGAPIPGATGATYTLSAATQSGNYSLVVTANGCVSPTATPRAIVVTGNPNPGPPPAHLALFPNPTPDGRVVLELTGYAQPVRVEIRDAVGRVVFTASLQPQTSSLDLSLLPAGVYSLRAFTEHGPVVRRLVRE